MAIMGILFASSRSRLRIALVDAMPSIILLSTDWILTHLFGQIEEDVYYHARRYFYVVAYSIPAIVTIIARCIGGAYLLSIGLGLGAVGVWIAMAILDWGFRALCFSIRWKRGAWKTKHVAF